MGAVRDETLSPLAFLSLADLNATLLPLISKAARKGIEIALSQQEPTWPPEFSTTRE